MPCLSPFRRRRTALIPFGVDYLRLPLQGLDLDMDLDVDLDLVLDDFL